MRNPFLKMRQIADGSSKTEQDRNRLWWEGLPMTYSDWENEQRIPSSEEDFRQIGAYVLRTAPWLAAWFDSLDLTGKSCLDLGSGSGIFSSLLARRNGNVTAMDLTETGVRLSAETSRYFSADIAIVRGDAEYAPFRDAAFDFVFSWGVLHHTSDMDRALREAGRILEPAGRGIMMVYHRTSVVYYVHGLFWLICRGKILAGHNLESVQDFYTDGFYHRYLTKAELRDRLAAAGLEVTEFTVTQYAKKILPLIPGWLDRYLKARFGMCLVAQFTKPAGSPGETSRRA